MSARRSYCTFRLDRLLAGLEVGRVQEVMGERPVTPVPLADRAFRGLINLRGQIVLAVDLRRVLGLEDAGPGGRAMSVVLRTPDGPVCLLVDEVLDIVDVAAESMGPPPETLEPALRAFASGTYPLASGLLLALDAEALVGFLGDGSSPGRGSPGTTSPGFRRRQA
jgi:purine-binding chemotaxis protein CheW